MEYLCRSFQLASVQFLWLFYISYPSPTRHVQYLAQAFYRFCLFRHDFKALVIKIFSHPGRFNCFLFPVAYPIQSFIIFFICVCLVDPAALRGYNQIQSIAHWCAYRPLHESHRPSTMYSTCVGGGQHHPSLCFETVRPFLHASCSSRSFESESNTSTFSYVDHIPLDHLTSSHVTNGSIACLLPLKMLDGHLTHKQAQHIAQKHGIRKLARETIDVICAELARHVCCERCNNYCTILQPAKKIHTEAERQRKCYHKAKNADQVTKAERQRKCYHKAKNAEQVTEAERQRKCYHKAKIAEQVKEPKFPPDPPSKRLLHKIISNFVKDTDQSSFVEAGCASCGQLTLKTQLTPITSIDCNLSPLTSKGFTRVERKSITEPIQEIAGPILANGCDSICKSCLKFIKKKKTPPFALASGLWIGDIPSELRSLTYVEKLLISRVRHNRCIVKVASGRRKMRANAISFMNPVPKIYSVLPPSLAELDEVLAFIFTGPCQPTKADIERTPLLVRRNHVANALNWLKLNHSNYADLLISEENLLAYPESDVPVVIDYRKSVINKDREATSIHDNEEEEGVENGPCSFVVQGLTGEEYSTMSMDAIKAQALEHLMKDGKIMFVGHSKDPLTIFKNPTMFTSMFPWLFPYGLGGLAQPHFEGRMSSANHKKHLLMYYDKRFQTDPNFPLIAFNHEQIQQSSSGSFLTAQKSFFSEVADRLLNIDVAVISDINKRLFTGERIKPETDEEKSCYQLMSDLDAVGGFVSGSLAKKKHMRNEVWSLISYIGAPSWFITISPADNKHPICLYYADDKTEFKPDIRLPDEAYRLIANNPVAAARFFDFICKNIIKHVFGVGQKHPGIYGETEGYYGVVEQQGRLTLHLHCILWIKGSPSPQEIRDRIMDKSDDFQKQMVEYLESVHKGEMFGGSLDDVKAKVRVESLNNPHYLDPTQTMPEAPPPLNCAKRCGKCEPCNKMEGWWEKFHKVTDDLLSRSNYHTCNMTVEDKNGRTLKKGCLNSKGQCRARFPRDVVPETMVDPLTGALRIKKGEAWMNTFTYILTYLLRSNSDVTSLLSGTAIKAIVAYVTDYITKPGLTTYSIFETVKQVFSRNSEMLGGNVDRQQAARSLMTKMVNALTAKMELGSPMAALYLLGNPDHYTGHKFKNLYWKSFVREARKVWNTNEQGEEVEEEKHEKVVLNKNLGKYVGLSIVQDYIYRPEIYKNMSLYEWTRRTNKRKCTKTERKEYMQCFKRLKEDGIFADGESNQASEDELDIIGGGESTHFQTELGDNNIDSADELNIINQGDTAVCGDLKEFHRFGPEHPQHLTHVVTCYANDPAVVVLFIGGSLPRCDQGDREYYCSTVLTLFKPWRTGYDLKKNKDRWDDAFREHEFSIQELKYMRNFNLKYECCDARDDYSAKMKNDKQESFMRDTFDELDPSNDQNAEELEAIYEDALLAIDSKSNYFKKLQSMNNIENIVRKAGWLDRLSEYAPQIDKEFKPEQKLSGSQWSAIVKNAKNAVFANKIKDMPSNNQGERNSIDENHNEVVIADISYIDKKFQAKQKTSQKLIDDIATEFKLNEEQDRAFRIVANHATLHQAEQLKMYIGGMGGTGKSQVIKALISLFNKRKEAHQIMILAPTGSAAALLNGSTYHSALGINNEQRKNQGNEHSILAQLRARLEGVEYIFLDEVSMVS